MPLLVKEKIGEIEALLHEALRDNNSPSAEETRLSVGIYFSHVDILRAVFEDAFDEMNLNVAGAWEGEEDSSRLNDLLRHELGVFIADSRFFLTHSVNSGMLALQRLVRVLPMHLLPKTAWTLNSTNRYGREVSLNKERGFTLSITRLRRTTFDHSECPRCTHTGAKLCTSRKSV